jgi:hypothetical protein
MWPTWADYIGKNFDEYYNYAVGGASNNYIMNRLIEVDSILNFNPETDLVLIGLTGFNRFSFLNNYKKDGWMTYGDLDSMIIETGDERLRVFHDQLWGGPAALYFSWVAVRVIKSLLTARNIPHKIIMGIDNSHYETDHKLMGIEESQLKFVKDIYASLDVKETIDEFLQTETFETVYFTEDRKQESHPHFKAHLLYVEKHFPEFLSEKARALCHRASTFEFKRRADHEIFWKNFCKTFMKSESNPIELIGKKEIE